MMKIASSAVALLILNACATIPPPTGDELAYCQKMEREMGLQHAHDHAEAKGLGINPMNVTHDQCRRMLGLS